MMTVFPPRLFFAAAFIGFGCPLVATQHANAQDAATGGRVETGKLGANDDVLDTGEYYDVYHIHATAGQQYVIDLYSDSFDTYLMVRSDDDPDLSLDNDDYEQQTQRSQIVLEPERDGVYDVFVTSFEAGESGAYRLTISDRAPSANSPAQLDEEGSLADGDERLNGGEFCDRFALTLEEGDTVVVDLAADGFDAYLFVRQPDDEDFEVHNDDRNSETTDSRITLTAPRSGLYEVCVTSFEAGETGTYRLTVSELRSSAGPSVQLDEEGELAAGDRKLDSGEYVDHYPVTLKQGDTVEINLVSTEFDVYLLVRNADDREFQLDNDDRDGQTTDAHITLTAPRSGVYDILVTSFKAGESGAYRLTVTRPVAGDLLREEAGELATGDDELDSGEFVDTYPIDATVGDSIVIDLYSDDFDTYLLLRDPEDQHFVLENDDFNGSANHSQVRFLAPESGTYNIQVTSFEPGDSGAYRLTIRASAFTPTSRRETGELASGDETLDGGEYVDTWHFDGLAGQYVRVELHSDEFDTYVLLRDPGGNVLENDDFNGRTDTSAIEAGLTESGEYSVLVTSYGKEEVGTYELLLDFDQPTAGTPIRDREPLAESGSFPQSLDADDDTLNGRYADFFSVELTAGERVIVRMQADFDSLLILTYPDGSEVEFDDELGGLNAAIDLIPEDSGEFYVTATSYDSNVTGDYTLQVTLDAPGRPVGRNGNIPVTLDQRILGVFVGIGDYEGEDDDLQFCDRDARILYDIVQREFNMRPADSVLLLNEDATRDHVRSALEEIGGRAGPDDLLMFFFSGHGDQAAGSEDPFDPDGIHETISLYDGALLDDDLAALINGSPAGLALVAIDSCFSGGFAKDVVSARGRMGIFSSEEDVLSVVPGRFRAGGYLSRFLAEAISERRHESDRNDDGCLTAHELSYYLGERYLQEVRSPKERPKVGEEFVDPEENLSFQRLVIDRGGLSHDQVLFRWD